MRKYRPRIYCTEADKALMWDRWQQGDSLEKIAQLFDRTHGSVARILRRTVAYDHRRERDPGERYRWVAEAH